MRRIIRDISASLLALLFITLGFTKRIKRKAKRGDFILSIYFHSPSKVLFEFCIKWLKRNHFNFLSQQDILLLSQKKIPFPRGGVVITVDDGWKSNEKNIAEVANRYKVPVAIFVSTEPVEKGNFWWPYIDFAKKNKLITYSVESLKQIPNEKRNRMVLEVQNLIRLPREALTIEQIKEIATSKYVTIGSHTISHPILINCDDKESYSELKLSKSKIEKWVNKKVYCFAYPNGNYSKREINYLKEMGYTLAYTTRADYLTESSLSYIYELPRFCVFERISKAEAICRILGVWEKFVK